MLGGPYFKPNYGYVIFSSNICIVGIICIANIERVGIFLNSHDTIKIEI